MKKVFLTLACVAFAAASMTSCKKDCRCITTIDGTEYTNTVVGNMSKKDCEAYKVTLPNDNAKFECKSE